MPIQQTDYAMKSSAIILIFVCTSLIASAQSNFVLRVETNFKGVRYEFVIEKSSLAATPKWAGNAPCPPLSPRRAQSIAIDYACKTWENGKRTIDTTILTPIGKNEREYGEWTTDTISLTPIGEDEWIYVVQLTPPIPSSGFNGMMLPVKIVVLMNGSVAPMRKI
jgi:hypothetical protein